MQLASKPQSKRKEVIIPPELWEQIKDKYNTSRFIIDAIREKVTKDSVDSYHKEMLDRHDRLGIK